MDHFFLSAYNVEQIEPFFLKKMWICTKMTVSNDSFKFGNQIQILLPASSSVSSNQHLAVHFNFKLTIYPGVC